MNFDNNSKNFKWIFTSLACIFSIIGICLPILIRSRNWIVRVDSFSGGILFATGFVHLLEDATDDVFKYGKTPYPVSGTTAVATFSALTIILVFFSSEKNTNGNINQSKQSFNKKIKSQYSFKSGGKIDSQNDIDDIEQELSTIDNDDQESNQDFHEPARPKHSNEIRPKKNVNINPDDLFNQNISCFSVMAVLFYLIFSMNSVLEGIKMGFIDTKRDFISFTLLVCIRKIFEGYLLGLTLLESKPNKYLYFSMMILYSLFFLIGTIFSIFLKIKINYLIFGILFSVSAGTFVYAGVSKWAVTFLNRRNWSFSDKLWNLGLFSLAIAVIILVAIAKK